VRTLKTKYLSDLIGDQYKGWSGQKVILKAPTGLGKTTFIVKVLLPYFREKGWKLLILCNRKLLRMQYWFDLVHAYDSYAELEKSVVLMSYQQLAQKIRNSSSYENLFYEYHAIVCDECHYFYTDSDFNGFGTYALLQAIVYAGIKLELIFMSATMQEVEPFIAQTINNCYTKLCREHSDWNYYEKFGNIKTFDFSPYQDFSRFHCACLQDMESLCHELVESDKKSVVFIDNKEKGSSLREMLIKTGKIDGQQIALLNADNLDEEYNNKLIVHLAIGHKLLTKVLITTAVLDNGVSIHDPDVGNLAIITESKVSFLQMIGRMRAEKISSCNLYFIIRSKNDFEYRMAAYEDKLEQFKNLESENLNRNAGYYEKLIWDNNDKNCDFFRNALVSMPYDYHFFTYMWDRVQVRYGDEGMFVNQFAMHKTGDLYLIESRFYSMAVDDPLRVIYEQMSWIGKEKDDLEILESSYHKQREQELRQKLLSVCKLAANSYKNLKKNL